MGVVGWEIFGGLDGMSPISWCVVVGASLNLDYRGGIGLVVVLSSGWWVSSFSLVFLVLDSCDLFLDCIVIECFG